MLGPFRIRNLPSRSPRRAAAGPATTTTTTPRRTSIDGAVVSVHGDKYDQWIRTIPGAKLRYTDADEDVITVGSKQELEDRLAEPIRTLSGKSSSKQKGETRPSAVPLRPASPAMHVFEIDPIEAAVQLWQRIERESSPEELTKVFGLDGAVPEPKNDLASPPSRTGLTLEEKQADYFRNSLPPQINDHQPASFSASNMQQRPMPHEQAYSSKDSSNVLTPTGIMQAQQAGEQLRARLGNPGPRIDRANAVNSWATYSQLSEPSTQQQHARLRPMSQPPGSLQSWDTSTTKSYVRPLSMVIDPLQTSSQSQPPFPRQGLDSDAHLSEAVHGSLLPAFYENVQASLAKLSPEMATLSGEVSTTDKNYRDESNESDQDTTSTGDEKTEAAETTLTKMVFTSIREMADILAKMNSQFDAQLTPKLVSERLKSKDKLLPTHRQDTVRDLFTLRRAIEEFALEVAETKQTLARFEDAKVFPENTNMVDFNSMTAATYAFGRLVRSMDDMIIAARRGMLPAQLEDGESKFHTPRRLARQGYEDVWSLTIKSIPSTLSRVDVRNLVYEVRREHKLKTIEPREINIHDGPPRNAEIVIEGTACAQETWDCLVVVPNNSLKLHLSERQVSLTRKHYPNVYRCTSGSLKEKDQSPAVPPTRADIDVARLKALQDRRAAWRKEFKARTQSVRFTESAITIDNKNIANENEKPQVMPPHPAVTNVFSSETSSKPALSDTSLSKNPQKYGRSNDLTLRPSRSDWELKNKSRRSLRPVQSQSFASDAHPSPPDAGIAKAHHATYHSLKYPPGPSPPAPPTQSSSLPSIVPQQPSIPLPPIASLQSFSLPPISQLEQGQPQPFQLPALSPPPSGSQSSRNDKQLPPILPQVLNYPQLNHQPSDVSLGPLPSFPALEPVRSQSVKRSDDTPNQQAAPGAWPGSDPAEKESFEAHFRRIVGRSPALGNGISPIPSKLEATQPSRESLPATSSISSDSASSRPPTGMFSFSSQPTVRRSATIASPPSRPPPPAKSAGGPWSRRPYSETFDGAGRSGQEVQPGVAPQPEGIFSGRMLTRPPSTIPCRDYSAPIAVALDSETSSDWAKVQYIVNQLKELGYGDVHNGGMDRLAMYTQLADGDLEATIDLIEEERQAWNEKEDVGANPPPTEPAPARDI